MINYRKKYLEKVLDGREYPLKYCPFVTQEEVYRFKNKRIIFISLRVFRLEMLDDFEYNNSLDEYVNRLDYYLIPYYYLLVDDDVNINLDELLINESKRLHDEGIDTIGKFYDYCMEFDDVELKNNFLEY